MGELYMDDRDILDEFNNAIDSFGGIEGLDNISLKSTETTLIKSNKETRRSNSQEENGDKTVEKDMDLYGKKDSIVYLVIDRHVHGLINYFRECGILVSNIYTNIEDARNTILIQSKPCRIIIADSGLGKFSTTKIRQELIDMIGICDENNNVTVFYTDSALKVDSLRKLGDVKLAIDWFKYAGTASMVATLLKYDEKYTLDEAADDLDKPASMSDIKSFKGLNSGIKTGDDIILTGLSSEHLIKNMLESTEGMLIKYDVNF